MDRQHNVNPPLGMFWPVVGGALDRLRRRCLPGRTSPLSETMGPITLEGGSVLQVPADDVKIPAKQHIPLPFSPPVDLVNSKF